jgi:hypothetical protein
MCNRPRVTALKLIVDNSQKTERREHLLARAVQAYWQAGESNLHPKRKDAAIDFLVPLRTNCPRGLAQKAQILEDMVETRRSSEKIAEFAASIADDALSVSRTYLSRAL